MVADAGAAPALNVVVLYDPGSVHVNTSREHLEAFGHYSRHRVTYATAVAPFPALFDLQRFDVVIVHYSVRLAFAWHMAPTVRTALRAFRGPKLLFIQDEYDNPEITSAAINDLGIDAVFSCVPPVYRRAFYHRVRPQVEFHTVLTGYVSPALEAGRDMPPPAKRPLVIGYRGRRLPYRYGKLAQEKYLIGERMKAICQARNVAHDIEASEDKRIYGDAWNTFLASCRATLGTESGSNIIDRDGSLTAKVNRMLAWEPGLTFEQVFERVLRPLEGEVMMNQVSPRIFEAIALRTGLILFEGTYSGVVQPGVHYLSLKKDFSNVDEVLRAVQDDRLLEAMTSRAHRDVIGSGKYRYDAMVQQVDAVIGGLGRRIPGSPRQPAHNLMAGLVRTDSTWQVSGLFSAPIDARSLLSQPRSRWASIGVAARRLAGRLPAPAKTWTRWLLNRVSPAGWLKAMRLLVVYATDAPARRSLYAYVTRRSVRQRSGFTRLWGDVLCLDALARVAHGKAATDTPFQLSWSFEPACARLELVSVATASGGITQVASPQAGATPAWKEIGAAVRRAGELEVVWDHSAVGAMCALKLARLWVRYPVGEAGMRRFEGLSAVSRREPDLVLQLLGSALGQQTGGWSPPVNHDEETDDVVAAPVTTSSGVDRPGEPRVLAGAVRKRAG